MSLPFEILSLEGKLAKITQHIDGDHPVNAQWVEWLLYEFVPASSRLLDNNVERIAKAFHDLNDDDRLTKIQQGLREGVIPASWVKWLIASYVVHAEPEIDLDGHLKL